VFVAAAWVWKRVYLPEKPQILEKFSSFCFAATGLFSSLVFVFILPAACQTRSPFFCEILFSRRTGSCTGFPRAGRRGHDFCCRGRIRARPGTLSPTLAGFPGLISRSSAQNFSVQPLGSRRSHFSLLDSAAADFAARGLPFSVRETKRGGQLGYPPECPSVSDPVFADARSRSVVPCPTRRSGSVSGCSCSVLAGRIQLLACEPRSAAGIFTFPTGA
jgi:hypothetical protein